MGSILHLNTVPPVGGDTLFASMSAAYEALSAPMKTYLENLTASGSGGAATATKASTTVIQAIPGRYIPSFERTPLPGGRVSS